MKRPERNKINLNADKYRKSDKHPSHKGVVDIDGSYYWVSGWFNDGEYGTYFKGDFKAVTDEEMAKYFSDDEQPKTRRTEQDKEWSNKYEKARLQVSDDIDDELPF
jgi:hypothetical protein